MRNNKKLIVFGIIFLLLVIAFVIWYIINDRPSEGYSIDNPIPSEPKKYAVNEYTVLTVTDEDMAKTYFSNFVNLMVSDPNRAYYLLDENYRNVKFGSIDNFIGVVKNYESATIKRFRRNGSVFYISDSNNNVFAFVVDGVMKYKVYLDLETVDIVN